MWSDNLPKALEYSKPVLDCVGDPVFILDRQYRNVFVNKALCEKSGIPLERWLGRTAQELFPKEQADIFMEDARQVFETGKQSVKEEQATDAYGNVHTIETTKTVYKDATGEQYLIGVLREITENKAAEEALKESEHRYRLLAENATDVISVLTLDLTYKYVSPSVKQAWGFSPEELIDQPISHNMTAESLEFVVSAIREDLEREEGETVDPDRGKVLELEMIRKDGSTMWVEVKASFLHSDNGDPIEIMGIARDITERKRMEEVLRRSELQLSQAMDLADIVYWEYDPVENVQIFNDAFYAFYGTTAEREGGYRMTGEEYRKRFVHPDDQPGVLETVQRILAENITGPLPPIEHRVVRRDGKVRHTVVLATNVMDASGRLIRRYGVNQDITNRKEVE